VLWHAAIAESPSHGVARAADQSLGWLVRSQAGRWVREVDPPLYEEAYFEGDPLEAGGYGDYGAQSGWRLEKARRQVDELRALAGLRPQMSALDVGSGYGFFRQALHEAGIVHQGLEISAHARAVARRLYDFDSAAGTLADHLDQWAGRFDLITLWDMIEHVSSPRALLQDVAACLRPGGVVAIKTPNIDCPEAEVFGPHYHSLKREHLVYFGAAGLHAAARGAGLQPMYTASTSHLLVGFVGAEQTARWAAALRGADVIVLLRKPAAAAAP
jgi:2-polyprenyl-3-methyl-5-hydroxy-6-metoxy-1,4-benzoquinol methylase